MNSLKTRLLLVPALFLSLPLVLAQAPSGPVSFYFDRATYPVWDFSGPYTFSQKIVGAGGSTMNMVFQLGLTQDLSGSLHGRGTTMVAIGKDVVSANFTASGSVSLGGNSTRVILNVNLAGDGLDLIGGQPRKFTSSLTYNLRVDPNIDNTPSLIAPVTGVPIKGSLQVSGIGSSTIVSGVDPAAFSIALPPGVDGAWACFMNVVSIGERINGTAAIVVDSYASAQNAISSPTTRIMAASVSAKYSQAKNQTQAVLNPLAGSSPMSLQLYFISGAAQPGQMSGKILGQTVKQ